MVRSILIGTALIATTAFVVSAHEAAPAVSSATEQKTEYRAQITEAGGHQGREYMQNGVVVVEGAPRWTEVRQSSSTRQVPRALEALFQIFD
jgi:hypothetical protein